MGRDIHVKILIKNKDEWEEVLLYNKIRDKFEEIEVYPYRNYALFDILNEKTDENYNIARPIVLEKLPEKVKKDINIWQESGGYGFKEVNLADLKLYFKENNDNLNPIKYFIERIDQYIDFAIDPWNLHDSDVKILYWFDW